MSEASTSRPSAARERLRAPGTVVPLLGLALILAAIVVVRSPFFELRTIEVTGNEHLDREAVLALGDVAPGSNLFSISVAGVERALGRSPWIARADVRRDLPGTLRIEVEEREALGVLEGSGSTVVVGSDGIVLERAGGPNAVWRGPLPSLGRSPRPLEAGERWAGAKDVLRVAAGFPDRLRRVVRSVTLSGRELELELRRGGRVRYGRAVSLRQKNAAVLSLLRFARREQLAIDYIDVRSASSPALKPLSTP